MDKQLFIPDRISVGFQKREGIYTGKLAYVVYYDQKGVRRKEKSWEQWCDKKIDTVDFENVPTEGFVLNKGVGGQRQSYGWNARNEYIRVYDPRDFEFEISVANLLFILRECDCNKGKGLEGKFVYAWDGTELVLLPEISADYQNSKQFTQLQSQGVKSKELIPGASYVTKKQKILTYLGKFEYHHFPDNRYRDHKKPKVFGCENKWIFWNGKSFVILGELKSIAVLNSDTVIDNFAELVDKWYKSQNGSKVVRLFTKEFKPKKRDANHYYDRDYWIIENPDGSYSEYWTSFQYQQKDKIDYVQRVHRITFNDGVLSVAEDYGTAYHPDAPRRDKYSWPHYGDRNDSNMAWVEPTGIALWAETEAGSKFKLQGGVLGKEEQ